MKKKTTWVFLYIKYTKFWSISLGHFIKHKLLIPEEWCKKIVFYTDLKICFPYFSLDSLMKKDYKSTFINQIFSFENNYFPPKIYFIFEKYVFWMSDSRINKRLNLNQSKYVQPLWNCRIRDKSSMFSSTVFTNLIFLCSF